MVRLGDATRARCLLTVDPIGTQGLRDTVTCLSPHHPSVLNHPKAGGGMSCPSTWTCTEARIYVCRATSSARSNRSPRSTSLGPLSTCGSLFHTQSSDGALRYPRSLTTQSKKRVAFTPLYPSEPLLGSQSHTFIHDCVSPCLIS
jgi:hypothetical protein